MASKMHFMHWPRVELCLEPLHAHKHTRHAHARTHAHAHVHTHTHTHTHTRTHTHSGSSQSFRCYLDNELDHGSANIDIPSHAVLITARAKFFPKNGPPAPVPVERKVGLSVFQNPGHCKVVQIYRGQGS